MNKLEFISSVISSLSWPLVLLTITILLRKVIENLLSNLNKVSYNNFEMEFARELEKMEISLESKVPSISDSQSLLDEKINTVAKISPIASITLAWLMVEQEITDTINRLAISPDYPPYNSPLKNINLLKEVGLIDLETEKIFGELREMRNKAVHGQISDKIITYFDAIKYH